MVCTKFDLTGRRCLVLDDEFLIALDIQQILERAGASHVACVATTDEALALIRRGAKFDVAVLDVKLNGADGDSLGVAQMLTTKGTPIVFLTGMRIDDVHAEQFSDAPVVEKPYETTALLQAVQRAIDRHSDQ